MFVFVISLKWLPGGKVMKLVVAKQVKKSSQVDYQLDNINLSSI